MKRNQNVWEFIKNHENQSKFNEQYRNSMKILENLMKGYGNSWNATNKFKNKLNWMKNIKLKNKEYVLNNTTNPWKVIEIVKIIWTSNQREWMKSNENQWKGIEN